MRTRWGSAATWAVNITAVIGLLCTLAFAVALVSGLRLVVLRSGSMSPTMPTGTLAITVPVAADELQTGQVISVHSTEGTVITHRVVQVGHTDGHWLVTLRGDANSGPDAAPYDVTDGARRVVMSVPGAGRAVMALRTPWLAVGAVALLVIAVLPGRSPEEPDPAEGPPVAPGVPARHVRASRKP